MESHERTGRPMGSAAFVAVLESALHRPLILRGAGRKAKNAAVSVATPGTRWLSVPS
jgi:hypothetical protein